MICSLREPSWNVRCRNDYVNEEAALQITTMTS